MSERIESKKNNLTDIIQYININLKPEYILSLQVSSHEKIKICKKYSQIQNSPKIPSYKMYMSSSSVLMQL